VTKTLAAPLVLLALGGAVGRAAPPARAPRLAYAPEQRVAHIRATLEAVRGAGPVALAQAGEYTRVLTHGACASSVERLKVECLMSAARRYCAGRAAGSSRACPLYMDIVLANALAEEQLLPPARRYQLMRAHKDWRRALAVDLRRTRGALAVDFRLRSAEAPHDGDDADAARLARDIDRYCRETSDESGLAVPTCVASLVWFLGASELDEASR
jgi:hypothetical protein